MDFIPPGPHQAAWETLMGPEGLMWQEMSAALRTFDPHVHLVRVENGVGTGTPDVNGCVVGVEWWAELKGLRSWKSVPDTRVMTLEHDLLPSQRAWLRARYIAGGNAWVILGVREPKEWLIWEGWRAAEVIGNSTRLELIAATALHALGAFPVLKWVTLLRRFRPTVAL